MMDPSNADPRSWDPAESQIAADLDRLARAEAADAAPDFESRVVHRSAPALRAAPRPFAEVLASTPVRIAAAVAVVLSGIALVLAIRQPRAVPAPEPIAASALTDLDHAVAEWLTFAALSGQDAFAAELDLLYAETVRLGEGLDWPAAPDWDIPRGSM